MKRRIDIRLAARIDLIVQSDFIALTSVEQSDRFIDMALSTFEWLAQMPRAGAMWTGKNVRGLRRWRVNGFPNHIVFYQVRPDALIVVRVLHAARDLHNLI